MRTTSAPRQLVVDAERGGTAEEENRGDRQEQEERR
jgi:hypothetical protein